ncbi:lysophospholipase L1-like esterase [Streptosporangium becharense]|uniref:Lysophospholipase L1-like esterase n=1 Tax=Streptosporangium becharense TaxID=1816182 RepID=A0A7W9IFU6_9ACTN|nr:SGNH/GDSL hydrolase family protein [Streptosporangium becharense]MBB2909256.1 lysophospholipase L1-like esterase [Streptosporangium becharense]MBB5819725.1 lysophospholipase L1-like esterase [Streptosporangium becharense]
MILGDSFTVGSGPVRAWDAYAALAARELGWQPVIAGASGTGYVNPGRVRRTFRQSFLRELSWRPEPDLLLISGGRNDRRIGAGRIRAAAVDLLELARRTWPDTRIAVIGPIWMTEAPGWAYRVRDAVATATDEAGVPFLDPLEPRGGRWGRGTVLPDRVHPTATGHARLAGWMTATLREYGIEPRG